MTKPPVVLLHGFLGSGADWHPLRAALGSERVYLAPDLPGHGATPAPVPDDEDAFLGVVAFLLAHAPPEPFDLVGYSMGGRFALALMAAAPERVRRAVIVSASPGIADEGERARRRELDRVRAAALRSLPFDLWLETWYGMDLFASLRASAAYEPMLARRREGRPEALASALEAFSPGRMPPLGQRLATCPVPALLMAGSLDAKYVASNATLAEANPAFAAATVAGAGHAPQLERPDDFHDAVRRWLDRP